MKVEKKWMLYDELCHNNARTHYELVLFSCEIMQFGTNKSKLTLKVLSKCDDPVICTYFDLKG